MTLRALRTPLTLAVLSMLRQQPRHPYEMQVLLRERHTAEVVKLRGGSLYDAIGRLHKAGLLEPVDTQRSGARPERTVYAITPAGRALLEDLIGQYLSTPAQEYPVFMAGLAHVANVTATEAAALLRQRVVAVQAEYDRVAGLLAGRELPRIVVLETEYAQVLRQAELDWLRRVTQDIDTGVLEWFHTEGGTS